MLRAASSTRLLSTAAFLFPCQTIKKKSLGSFEILLLDWGRGRRTESSVFRQTCQQQRKYLAWTQAAAGSWLLAVLPASPDSFPPPALAWTRPPFPLPEDLQGTGQNRASSSPEQGQTGVMQVGGATQNIYWWAGTSWPRTCHPQGLAALRECKRVQSLCSVSDGRVGAEPMSPGMVPGGSERQRVPVVGPSPACPGARARPCLRHCFLCPFGQAWTCVYLGLGERGGTVPAFGLYSQSASPFRLLALPGSRTSSLPCWLETQKLEGNAWIKNLG